MNIPTGWRALSDEEVEVRHEVYFNLRGTAGHDIELSQFPLPVARRLVDNGKFVSSEMYFGTQLGIVYVVPFDLPTHGVGPHATEEGRALVARMVSAVRERLGNTKTEDAEKVIARHMQSLREWLEEL